MGAIEIPNCDDPVFRTWCKACGIAPGELVDATDPRVDRLERLLRGQQLLDDDDYLNPFPEQR